ncbi:MAG TPA: hypothetical protein DC047_11675 [Blastocatellia bacterium]|nr:hypothetical protein [Blastocatellia bacterium]
MPPRDSQNLPHIILRGEPLSEPYTVAPGGGSGHYKLPPRRRREHGENLRTKLEEIAIQSDEQVRTQEERATTVERGTYVEFESAPGFPLKVESLEDRSRGVEVVAVSGGDEEHPVKATVFVREGKLDLFLKKIEQYVELETKTGNPRNQTLVESISEIRLATIRGLWTDAGEFPNPHDEIWWEAWLRVGDDADERYRNVAAFREEALAAGLTVSENELFFPESTVMLVRASADQLATSIFLINALAELRIAKRAADFFYDLPQAEQGDWIRRAIARIVPSGEDSSAVCLLDTGVNNEHPLIIPGLAPDDMTAYNPDWGVFDHHGHGTEMAGLGLYGDLVELFQSTDAIELHHRLESVKILPPAGATDPELYGDVTTECAARAELLAPDRRRAFCLTVTTTDSRDRGQPTSWSAAIDQICSGALEEEPRKRELMLISAGNTDYDLREEYPSSNLTDGVHDPGQAWNAVTVGAYTEKDSIDPDKHPESIPVAQRGGLAPCSTTSISWESQWPLKPDIVLEGGNMARHPSYSGPFELESLLLLTTNAQFENQLLTFTKETSAATALAARMGAMIFAEYPNFWAETVRGLLVHSAEWTAPMRPNRILTKREIENLLRVFGYGVPQLTSALYSARNSLTLISEAGIKPFRKESNQIKTNHMHLYELPWPSAVLSSLGETQCEMHVTLSYFIEPNPTRRGYKNKYRYASHGLRFDTKTPTESMDDFRRRINRIAREEVDEFDATSGDSASWLLGPQLRTRGSIHSDIWRGPAIELAEKGYVAIYPVSGWWRDLKRQERWDSVTRYSLIVTIQTEDINVAVDIYTPIANIVLV